MELNYNIGNIKIKGGLSLGPMAGVSDLPFRILCKEMGASLLTTEMVSAKAIMYENKKTFELMNTDKFEKPIALQLFGSDPDILGKIIKEVSSMDFDMIDFNMGCPMPKIVNNGEGSFLMTKPELCKKIFESMVKNSKKPVTIKIRKGFCDNSVNAVEIAKIAEQLGISAVAVHARTAKQLYSGKADWDIIKAVKEEVKIPVIGNGDVVDGISALNMLKYTNCDGIMIARAAKGNPFIFRSVSEFLKVVELDMSIEDIEKIYAKTHQKPSLDEIKESVLRQAKMQIDLDGEYMAMLKMRKHLSWYTHGIKGSSELRRQVSMLVSYNELEKIIDKLG